MRIIMLAAAFALAFTTPAFAQKGADDMPESAAPDTLVEAQNAAEGEQEATPESGPLTATDKIVNRFMELDTDTSEGVSFEEYMVMVQQRAQDRFASMDANQDGEVTADEYREFWMARKAQYYRPKR